MTSQVLTHRLMVLGDPAVGKTALIIQLCMQQFIESHDCTINDEYRWQADIDGRPCMLEIIDCAVQEEYAEVQNEEIHNSEGFLLVYSVSSRSSLSHIKRFHRQIQSVKGTYSTSPPPPGAPITTTSPQLPVPFILVGNKCDQGTEREVSIEEGRSLALELGCDFFETSAKDDVDVNKPFYDIVRALRQQRQQLPHITSFPQIQKPPRFSWRSCFRKREKRDPGLGKHHTY